MLLTPNGRVDVVSIAVPPVTGADPIDVVPSKKVTLPVGVPAPGKTGTTAAVKVTARPNTDGFRLEITLVVVIALFTTCTNAVEVLLALKLLSPA